MQEQIAAVCTRATRYASILCGGLILATATLASAVRWPPRRTLQRPWAGCKPKFRPTEATE